jgi:phytoene dehydrogenase-like protein
VKDLAGYYHGIEELEIGRIITSWPELAQRHRATNGNWAHVDYQLLTCGPLRPALGLASHEIPAVPGLFLSGAGTHPGPGVSGIPGQLAARAVLRRCARSA